LTGRSCQIVEHFGKVFDLYNDSLSFTSIYHSDSYLRPYIDMEKIALNVID